jgi:hypothetical protein
MSSLPAEIWCYIMEKCDFDSFIMLSMVSTETAHAFHVMKNKKLKENVICVYNSQYFTTITRDDIIITVGNKRLNCLRGVVVNNKCKTIVDFVSCLSKKNILEIKRLSSIKLQFIKHNNGVNKSIYCTVRGQKHGISRSYCTARNSIVYINKIKYYYKSLKLIKINVDYIYITAKILIYAASTYLIAYGATVPVRTSIKYTLSACIPAIILAVKNIGSMLL